MRLLTSAGASAAGVVLSGLCSGTGVSFPIYNDLAHQRYLLNLTVGTPPQPYSLIVDTGSADFWLPLPNSTGCAAQGCPAGTYNPADSQSSRDLGLPFNATYGLTPGNDVEGIYVNDTIEVGSATIPDMTIGVGNVPPNLFNASLWGIAGLGSPLQESVYNNPASPVYQQPDYVFPTLWEQLYLHGYTSRRLFSVWMNQQSAAEGTINFGRIDNGKFVGGLRTIGVILGQQAEFTSWVVNLTSVQYLDSEGGETSLTGNDWSIHVVLDTASPNMYLPAIIYNHVADLMGAQIVQGFPYVPCSVRNSTESLQFGFGMSMVGPQITVPFKEIIYPYGLPANIGEIKDETGNPLCYLGLIETEGSIFLLGATFIRSAYVVFDVDGLQVAMSQARFL
ncbi:eukaryotic aspartyl protease [Seiridium cupressi]